VDGLDIQAGHDRAGGTYDLAWPAAAQRQPPASSARVALAGTGRHSATVEPWMVSRCFQVVRCGCPKPPRREALPEGGCLGFFAVEADRVRYL
jgi:hypothetical protein